MARRSGRFGLTDYDFPEADRFLKGDHPEKLTVKEASALGRGHDLDHSEDEINERLVSKSVKRGDLVAFRKGQERTMEDYAKNGENIFTVIDVHQVSGGGASFTVQNTKNPKNTFSLRSYFFKKLNTDENNSSGTQK